MCVCARARGCFGSGLGVFLRLVLGRYLLRLNRMFCMRTPGLRSFPAHINGLSLEEQVIHGAGQDCTCLLAAYHSQALIPIHAVHF